MSALAVQPDQIPAELRATPQWVIWRYGTEGDGRPTKHPYNPRIPDRKASSTDPATWASFDCALTAYTRTQADGVSFALAPTDPFVGVDIDHAAGPGGLLPYPARLIVADLCTYTEWSPSGTGLRFFCRGTLPPVGRKRGPYEFYSEARFLTVTGWHLAGTPGAVAERTAALAQVHARIWPPTPPDPAPIRRRGPALSDAEVLTRARAGAHGARFSALYDSGDVGLYGGDQSAADLALAGALLYWTGGDSGQADRLFRASRLMRAKWDSRRPGGTYGTWTLTRAAG